VADIRSDSPKGRDGGAVVIKKYANRRLYDTASSVYVTLEDLARMVHQGQDFVVYDAKTGEDLTRQILTQIIFEEESRGGALLPVQFLRQLIGFYGGQMQSVLPGYLEMSLDSFARQQEQLQGQMAKALGGTSSPNLMEAAVKQNMAVFQKAMSMFPGFAYPATAPEPAAKAAEPDPLDEMRRQMDEMRARLDDLAKPQSPGKGL